MDGKINTYSLHWEEDAIALNESEFMHGARIECKKDMLSSCVDYLFACMGVERKPTRRCYHETATESKLPSGTVRIGYITIRDGKVTKWQFFEFKERVLKIDNFLKA